MHAEITGVACLPANNKKKLLLETVKRAVCNPSSVSKQVLEAAAVSGMRICKAASYAFTYSNLSYVALQSTLSDIKVTYNTNRSNSF